MHAAIKPTETNFDPLNTAFSLILKARWLAAERYRAGTLTLIKECKTVEQLAAIEHMLEQLRYCTSSDLQTSAEEAAKTIVSSWGLFPSDSILVGLAESNKTCGSTAYVRAIEINLPRTWNGSIWPNFDSTFRLRNGKKNLIIVDDFVGTGEKLSTKIKRIKENPKTEDYKIHVVTFAGMDEGLTKIADEVDNLIFAYIALDKSVASVKCDTKRQELYGAISELEANIFSKPGKYSFGYMQSEAAFFLEAANIPNNNFPILWWDKYLDDSDRSPLFRRR